MILCREQSTRVYIAERYSNSLLNAEVFPAQYTFISSKTNKSEFYNEKKELCSKSQYRFDQQHGSF